MNYTFTGAIISDDGLYRYSLIREWDDGVGSLVIAGLNPSTADGKVDDPTIRREVAFARAWGMRKLVKVNLFAYRATDPLELQRFAGDIVGPDNDAWIRLACDSSDVRRIIVAWGAWGDRYRGRVAAVLNAIGRPVECLSVTKSGQPKHPLYLRADIVPQPWSLPA